MNTIYVKSLIIRLHKLSQSNIAILRETSLKHVEELMYMNDL